MFSKVLGKIAGGMIAGAVMVLGVSQANAVTVVQNLLVHVSDPVNDPAPNNLVCTSTPEICGGPGTTEAQTNADFFGNVVDINSAALAKYDVDDAAWEIDAVNFDITFSDSMNGTWSQTIIAGALLTHYVVAKAGTEWSVLEVVLPAVLNVGDVITGSWSTASALFGGANLSHLSLYNSQPCSPNNPDCGGQQAIPLPAAFPLFASGLGVLGLLGWRRRRKAAA